MFVAALFPTAKIWKLPKFPSTDGIKIAGRNNNNLRYADDTILMAESKEN